MYGSYDKGLDALYKGYYDTVNDLIKRINNLVVDNARIKNLNVDKLYATDTKMSTALIEDLVVGDNVLMGENASIVWGQIDDPPDIPAHPDDIGAMSDDWRPTYGDIIGAKPPTDANNTYSELLYNSNIRGFVNVGGNLYISADYIYSGTITGVTINVNTNLRVGNNIYVGPQGSFGSKGVYWDNGNSIRTLTYLGTSSFLMTSDRRLVLEANNGIDIRPGSSATVSGNLVVNNNLTVYGKVSGVSWSDVSSKPSTFPPSSHSHSWSQITSKPSTFPPSTHNHHGTYVRVSGSRDVWLEGTSAGNLNVYINGNYVGHISL